MTAVIDAEHKVIDCPHCKGKLNVEIERKPATVTLTNAPPPEDLEKMIERAMDRKLPKEPEKPKEIEVPAYTPKTFCKGKGCEGHDNPKRKKITKKCNNCDQVAPENAGKCAFCGEKDFDDLDEDQLEIFNKGMEHEHEHE